MASLVCPVTYGQGKIVIMAKIGEWMLPDEATPIR